MRRFLMGLLVCVMTGCAMSQAVVTRDVTQTVFTADGKPAAHATVQMSYCQNGAMEIMSGTADATGVVAWKNVPAVPAIVWGAGVPAGVLPLDATLVTAPLPAPIPTAKVAYRLQLTGAPAKSGYAYIRQGAEVTRVQLTYGDTARLTAGAPATLSAVTLDPMGGLVLKDIYLAYPPAGVTSMLLRLTLHPGITRNGRLLLKNGAPLTGVCRLTARPLALETLDEAWINQAMRENLQTTFSPLYLYPDGHFTVVTPLPGTVRLCLDLFDTSVPPVPGLIMNMQPGLADMNITLPEPLLTVPAGAEVGWFTRAAPFNPHLLQAPAYQGRMPLYGPADALLAVWYHPSASQLTVWSRGTTSTLTRRTFRLTVNGAKATPMEVFGPRFTLRPPLVATREGTQDFNNRELLYLRSLPEATSLRSPRTMPWEIEGYTGSYLLQRADEGMYGRTTRIRYWIPLSISERGPVDFTFDEPPTAFPQPSTPIDDDPPPTGTLSGRVLGVDGAPLANVPVIVGTRQGRRVMGDVEKDPQPRRTVATTTDATGAFTATQVPCGPGFITAGDGRRGDPASWVVMVPAAGLTNLTLQAVARPLSVFLEYSSAGMCQVWWVPEQGTALPVPVFGQYARLHNAPAVPGMFWTIDTQTGAGQCQPYSPGMTNLSGGNALSTATLGISLPLAPAHGLPGAVTLTGQGARQGLRVIITQPVWQPATWLNRTVTQIDAVPPGVYQVTVETDTGPKTGMTTVAGSGGFVEL